MNATARASAVLLVALTLLTGALYPAAVTAVARLLFPGRAAGSLVFRAEGAVGSRLIGQPFTGAQWFHGRPSAAPKAPYDPFPSGGSNLGPLAAAWRDSVRSRVAAAQNREGTADPVPVDLVTASGSGLDPHISPAAAYDQIPRVARARALPEAAVRTLVDRHVEGRTLGLLGEPRVNVLALNLALADLSAGAGEAAPSGHGTSRR